MDNWFIYLPLLYFFIIIPMLRRKRNSSVIATKKIKNKKLNKEERMKMYELIKRFIGKKCNISIMNSSTGVLGTVMEVQDNWVIIDTDGSGTDAVNIDYITRITEWPVKEKKKK